jgi:hypothetical protein
MLIIAGAVGWWSMTMEADIETNWYSMTSDYKFDFTFEELVYEMEVTTDGDRESQDGDENLDGDMEDVGGLTGLIFTLGIVMVIIVIVLLILLLVVGYTGSPGIAMYTRLFKNMALLFTFLALIFVLIAPIYYMVAWPAAVEDDLGSIPVIGGDSDEEIYDGSFMGSKSITEQDSNIDINWGPGLGWFLAIVCLILLLITIVLVKTGGDQVMRMAPALQLMPQQQYGGYGPQQPGQYQPPPQQPPYQPPQYPPPPQQPP